jgi:hypothetical protein
MLGGGKGAYVCEGARTGVGRAHTPAGVGRERLRGGGAHGLREKGVHACEGGGHMPASRGAHTPTGGTHACG